jgi:hypothetical protein
MNTSKSDLGPMAGAITKLVFTVQQSPTTLKFSQAVSTTQGDQTIDRAHARRQGDHAHDPDRARRS